MSYGISVTPHRDVVQRVRNLVLSLIRGSAKDREKDIVILDTAHEAHIRAKVDFSTSNSDYTMINLIGTWARLNRVMMEMEEKYGLGR